MRTSSWKLKLDILGKEIRDTFCILSLMNHRRNSLNNSVMGCLSVQAERSSKGCAIAQTDALEWCRNYWVRFLCRLSGVCS